MVKTLDEDVAKIVADYPAAPYDEPKSTAFVPDRSYLKHVIKDSSYDQAQQKEVKRILRRERDFRYNTEFGMEGFFGRIAVLWNYFAKDKNEYTPKMSHILEKKLSQMNSSIRGLRDTLGDLRKHNEELDKYYFKVLGKARQEDAKIQKADERREHYKRKIAKIKPELENAEDYDDQEYFKMLGSNKVLHMKLAEQNRIWLDNLVRKAGRLHQVNLLDYVSELTKMVDYATTSALSCSEILAETVGKISPLADHLPEIVIKEGQVEKQQQELKKVFSGFTDILADLFIIKYRKLEEFLGGQMAYELVGEGFPDRIKVLRSAGQ